jgi:UDP-N-acetylglucosamine 3-dehydrogenase
MTNEAASGGARAPLRVGLAGLGSIGQNHLRLLSARADVRLVAVADPVGESLDGAVRRSGATGYADALEMLDDAQLDALVIATPTTLHAAIALAAIERGIPALVEKPLAASVEDGFRILGLSRRRGVPIQVGHVERFNPAVRELDRLLRQGWLSSIYSISSRRAGPFPARIRDVGVTVDLATHDVDILSWITRERPSRVFAETAQRIHAAHEDLLFALLSFPSGTTGFLDVNWLTPSKRRQLHVVGEEGMFDLDYLTQRLTFTRHPDTSRPTMIQGYAPTFSGDVLEVPLTTAEPLAEELDAFLAVARGGVAPMVDAEDGLWAVAIAEAMLQAADSHMPVQLSGFAARLLAA